MSTNRTAGAPPGRAALVRSALAAAAAAFAAAALLAASPAPAAAGPVGALTVKLTAHPPEFTKDHTATFNWATVGILGETRCKIDSGRLHVLPGPPGALLPARRPPHLHRARPQRLQGRRQGELDVDGRHRGAHPAQRHRRLAVLAHRHRRHRDRGRRHRRLERRQRIPAPDVDQRRPLVEPRLPGPPCWSSPRDRRWSSSAPRIAPATSPPGRPAPPLPATPSASTAPRPPCRRCPAAR